MAFKTTINLEPSWGPAIEVYYPEADQQSPVTDVWLKMSGGGISATVWLTKDEAARLADALNRARFGAELSQQAYEATLPTTAEVSA